MNPPRVSFIHNIGEADSENGIVIGDLARLESRAMVSFDVGGIIGNPTEEFFSSPSRGTVDWSDLDAGAFDLLIDLIRGAAEFNSRVFKRPSKNVKAQQRAGMLLVSIDYLLENREMFLRDAPRDERDDRYCSMCTRGHADPDQPGRCLRHGKRIQ